MKRLPLLWLALTAAAFAADPAPVTHDFLAAGAIDYRTVLIPPPAEDSLGGQADHEVAKLLDADRTPAQAALAKHFENLSIFTMLSDVLGQECTAKDFPRTAAVFAQANAESRPIVDAAKAAWNRQRPYVFNPALHPAVDKPNNASYPSGHAYSSAWIAVLLGAALPEHAADFTHEAELVRWSRLVGGAHYPSDVLAGKILGEAIGREMLKSPKLRQALEEVRAELLACLQKKAA